jgi:hypothetical protein
LQYEAQHTPGDLNIAQGAQLHNSPTYDAQEHLANAQQCGQNCCTYCKA